MKNTLLVIEDDPQIQEMLSFFLESKGFEVIPAHDYSEGMARMLSKQPIHLILLDWMIPGGSGIQLLKNIKKDPSVSKVPVIMLTARTALEDKLTGLDSGADDYIDKPFSLKELHSRINAVLRRSHDVSTSHSEILEIDNVRIDLSAKRLFVDDELIDVGRIEFRLLIFFATHLDKVFTRTQILDMVWGSEVYIDERTVDVSVGRLRKILEKAGKEKMLQTGRGEGYRFSSLYK